MENTEIGWTDHTFNPWWGCTRVSPGCQNCYAEAFAKRTGNDVWGKNNDRRFFGDKHWDEPLRWNARAMTTARRERVFCASMADVFEDRRDLDSWRQRLWELIVATPMLDWLLLTKRPENVLDLCPDRWPAPHYQPTLDDEWSVGWPRNIWLGVTVEDQQRADERIPVLLEIPAIIRFLSCEPLLGPVSLERWLGIEWMDALRVPGEPLSFRGEGGWGAEMFATLGGYVPPIHWVIAGGESGPRHRPMNTDHARDLRDQCVAGSVAFFFKQHGGNTPKAGGKELDGREYCEFPDPWVGVN